MIRGVLILLATIASLGAADSPHPTLAIDPALLLTISGSPGSFHIILTSESLNGNQGWQVWTNLTLDASGNAAVQLSPAVDGSQFYKRFGPEGFVAIPPGTFVMGSPESEKERYGGQAQHTVILTKGFWMGRWEVTQGEYLSVMGNNPSFFTNGVDGYTPGIGGIITNELRYPVEQVNWIDATKYCKKLTQRDLASGLIPTNYTYRLPTEAEWEYACRAGTTTAFWFGTAIRQGMENFDTRYEYESSVGHQAMLGTEFVGRTVEVGSYAANAFGLYDMHGNVREWCSDWWDIYPMGVVTDPMGPSSGNGRVTRGGGWASAGGYCHSAIRLPPYPAYFHSDIGFRVVLGPGL